MKTLEELERENELLRQQLELKQQLKYEYEYEDAHATAARAKEATMDTLKAVGEVARVVTPVLFVGLAKGLQQLGNGAESTAKHMTRKKVLKGAK
jgi:hypothetical protein